MPTHRAGEPWSGLTYNGFAGTPGAEPRTQEPQPRAQEPRSYAQEPARAPHAYAQEPHPEPARRSSRRKGVFLGVGAALGLGLLVGVLARPDLTERREAPKTVATATTQAAAPARSLPVEVAPETTAALAPADRLDVLPPESERIVPPPPPPLPSLQAQAAPRPTPAPMRQAEAAPRAAPPPVLRQRPSAPLVREAPPQVARMAPVAPRAADAPSPVRAEAAVTPSFNCRLARSRSERMVCGDASLAQLDRRLNAAFRTAVSAGVPYRELRADQDDWLEIREDAATHSRSAVASIYRQRIGELEDMAVYERSERN